MSAKKQTLLLTAVNTVVRALGLWMRVLLSRMLGAEIMGITELCASVHMLAIAPLTSGLPLAVSRLTAKSESRDAAIPLHSAMRLVRVASIVMIPALLLLSPVIANIVGDQRILPSLWMTAPCILVLGYSASFNGYCYGTERSWIPAVSELLEQLSRFGLAILLLTVLTKLTSAWMAAVPVFATLVAELIGLAFVVLTLRIPHRSDVNAAMSNRLIRLAAPTTATRLINTALRSATAILIPLRLQSSGLPAAEATARLGMLNGMVLPIVMLPCVFTSALSMVALPRLAKAERCKRELRRLYVLIFGSSALIGVACAIAVSFAAPILAVTVYRHAELAPLFRQAAPLVAFTSLGHASAGVLAGLGKQKRAMFGTLFASAITLLLTWSLPPGLSGALHALTLGQAAILLWNLLSLYDRSARSPGSASGRRRKRSASEANEEQVLHS